MGINIVMPKSKKLSLSAFIWKIIFGILLATSTVLLVLSYIGKLAGSDSNLASILFGVLTLAVAGFLIGFVIIGKR
jgi:hypothetical protein